jgi:hypothetical protein
MANLKELAPTPAFSVNPRAEIKCNRNQSLLKSDQAIQHSKIETKLKSLQKMCLNPQSQTLTEKDQANRYLLAEYLK